MSEDMPMEIWALPHYTDKNWKGTFAPENEVHPYSKKYHHDDKYRALEAENTKLREENERLKTAIAEAKIVQYAVEG